jgi:hypothetical protein
MYLPETIEDALYSDIVHVNLAIDEATRTFSMSVVFVEMDERSTLLAEETVLVPSESEPMSKWEILSDE